MLNSPTHVVFIFKYCFSGGCSIHLAPVAVTAATKSTFDIGFHLSLNFVCIYPLLVSLIAALAGEQVSLIFRERERVVK